ncbi:MAG: hypothetical protein E7463_09220 [Ruminococcaceae bacterium]|nr:hypothetical protein [Oscillospiraceae bacterium]
MQSRLRIPSWLLLPAVFLLTAAILTAALTGAFCLPEEPVRAHALESAVYWQEHENAHYYPLFGTDDRTSVHNYADAIWVGIAAHAEPSDPFASMLYAGYRNGTEGKLIFDALRASMEQGLEPDVSYHRYWHGSLVLIRPLLMMTGIVGIRWVCAAIYVLGLGCLVWMMKKRGFSWITVGVLGASLLCVGGWVVPLCLEYVFCFYVTIGTTIAVLALAPRGARALRPVFVVSGVCMCFFDFFTAETLAFLIPAALYVLWRHREGSLGRFRGIFLELVSYGVCFLGAYAAMYALKWGLTSVTLDMNAVREAAGAAAERAFEHEEGALATYLYAAQALNLSLLPWFTPGETGGYVGLLVLAAMCAAGLWLLRPKKGSGSLAGILALLAAVPFARYLVLFAHSYQHATFTYRAQWATIFCVVMLLLTCVQWKREKKNAAAKTGKKRGK